MLATHCSFRLAVVGAGAVALTSTCAQAQSFTQTCSSPAFPGPAVAIDSRCSAQGAGGEEAEQNQAKNNFWAVGTLQSQVEQNKSINFGDIDNPGMHGPTTNRTPLKTLGEGKLVQLRAFMVGATQEGLRA